MATISKFCPQIFETYFNTVPDLDSNILPSFGQKKPRSITTRDNKKYRSRDETTNNVMLSGTTSQGGTLQLRIWGAGFIVWGLGFWLGKDILGFFKNIDLDNS